MEIWKGARVAVSGASGFVGSAVTRSLRSEGVTVLPMVRREPRAGEIGWDPGGARIDAAALEGIDAVVHLAGESIAGLWTPARKRRIHESRALGTTLLANALAGLENPPRVLLSASGVGYYGDGGEAELREGDPAGDDFMARVCVAWENATGPAARAGIRVVNARFGVVLDPAGGALATMLPVFRLGLGARLGKGRQWMSWISRHDLVRALRHGLASESLRGPLNVVAPAPIRNAEFTEQLGRALHRPTFLAAPERLLKVAAGGMADALLLVSQRAVPAALAGDGFTFERPTFQTFLAHALDGRG